MGKKARKYSGEKDDNYLRAVKRFNFVWLHTYCTWGSDSKRGENCLNDQSLQCPSLMSRATSLTVAGKKLLWKRALWLLMLSGLRCLKLWPESTRWNGAWAGWCVSLRMLWAFFPAARSEGGVHGREVRTTWGPTHMVLYGGSFGLWSSWMDPESEELHMRADRRGNFALACSFSHFSIRSASAHLPDKPSGLGGSGLQACQLWDYDMSPVVTRLQMSVLLTSNGGREGRTVLPALRIHELRTHTIFPPSLFSHPQVRNLCDLYARWHTGYCQETLVTFIRYRKILNKS